MGKVTKWIHELLEDDNGVIYLEVTAEHRTKTGRNDCILDVYREYEDGRCECRNIYYSMYAGRCVLFPGEYHSSYYYGSGKVCEENYDECRHIDFPCFEMVSQGDLNLFTRKYHEFVNYLYPAIPENMRYLDYVFRVLCAWKEHKEVEYLIKAGYPNLIFNKTFWKMSKSMSKKVTKYIRNNPGLDMKLRDIQCCIREKITLDELKDYRNSYFSKRNYKAFKYLRKQMEICNFTSEYTCESCFQDYRTLLKETAHNPEEEYWKYPSNLREFHDAVLQEVEEARERKLAAQKKATQKRIAEMYARLEKRAARWPRLTVNGYDIYATSDANDWLLQAKTLHQCIVGCHYDQGMADGQYDILFIRKDGVPVATAQVYSCRRIGQFYADEHSGTPQGSLPTDEVTAAFNEYLEICKEQRKAKRARRAA